VANFLSIWAQERLPSMELVTLLVMWLVRCLVTCEKTWHCVVRVIQ
jgi:hypothetical protein